jgi:DNA (cytosine-5)-methyltransferase 1
VHELSLGTICSGIGGWDIGFEEAGWETRWQIELDDVNRYCLADRFPRGRQFKNVRDWRAHRLSRVRCIAFSSPCQNLSIMANFVKDQSQRGLGGGKSCIFFDCMEAIEAVRPEWVVFENVPNLLHSNDGRDIQAVVSAFAQLGYLGAARVLNSSAFGVPQHRRRLLLVARLGQEPPPEFMADAGPMEALPVAFGSRAIYEPADSWAGYTLTAPNKYNHCNSRINIGSELLVAEEGRWHQMAERSRAAEIHGFPRGLDAANTEEAYAAGNAMPPPMARWLAEIITRALRT